MKLHVVTHNKYLLQYLDYNILTLCMITTIVYHS